MATTRLGMERVLALADTMRRLNACVPHRLYHECTQAFVRGEISFDQVTPLYRHAMIHAGGVVPRDEERFSACPECGAELPAPLDDGSA